jgi:hypothetical protein
MTTGGNIMNMYTVHYKVATSLVGEIVSEGQLLIFAANSEQAKVKVRTFIEKNAKEAGYSMPEVFIPGVYQK